jgi:hypothetical protein
MAVAVAVTVTPAVAVAVAVTTVAVAMAAVVAALVGCRGGGGGSGGGGGIGGCRIPRGSLLGGLVSAAGRVASSPLLGSGEGGCGTRLSCTFFDLHLPQNLHEYPKKWAIRENWTTRLVSGIC